MAQGDGADEADGGDGYFASVSDLMVGILFVFLLVLTVFALNFRDAERDQLVSRQDLVAALAKARVAESQADEARQQALLAQARALLAQTEAEQQKARANLLLERNESLREALDKAVARLQLEIRDREEARSELLARIGDQLHARGVTFHLDQQSGVLRLSEDVPFNTGRSDLTERTRHTTQVLADVLAGILPCFSRAPDRSNCAASDTPILEAVFVEGHTDRQAFTGMTDQQSQQENDRLSTERALTVFAEMRRLQPTMESLRNNDDVPLLGVSGYGARRPLPEATGSVETDYAQNRRIDLRFVLASRTSDEIARLVDEIKRLAAEHD
jgi:flagellar motor protein MotB